jgi:hypothetical protein
MVLKLNWIYHPTEAQIEAKKEVDVEVNTEKTTYISSVSSSEFIIPVIFYGNYVYYCYVTFSSLL